jgi:hypothetical protein
LVDFAIILMFPLATLIGNLFKKFKTEFLALEEDGAILRSFKDDKKRSTNLNYSLTSCTSVVIRSDAHNNAGWPADIAVERCFVLNNAKNSLVYFIAETPELAKEWIDKLEEARQKHYVEPPVKTKPKAEEPPQATAETTTEEPPKTDEGATPAAVTTEAEVPATTEEKKEEETKPEETKPEETKPEETTTQEESTPAEAEATTEETKPSDDQKKDEPPEEPPKDESTPQAADQ